MKKIDTIVVAPHLDHMVAGGAGGREDGGIGDGGALVAEQTAADDRANHKRNGNIKGNGHGEGDGHHNGPHPPRRSRLQRK